MAPYVRGNYAKANYRYLIDELERLEQLNSDELGQETDWHLQNCFRDAAAAIRYLRPKKAEPTEAVVIRKRRTY